MIRSNDMLLNIRRLIFSSTAKDSYILYVGNILSVAINFLITILLTRNLSTSEFGVFITGIVFLQLLVDLFELGINPALINLVSSSKDEAKLFIKSSFLLKLIISITVSLVLVLSADFIAISVFKNKIMSPVISFSALGFIFLTIIFWGQSVFQAQRNFLYSAILNTSINVLRLLFLGALLLSSYFNLYSSFFVSQIVLGFSALFVIYKLGFFLKFRNFKKKGTLEIIRFGLPIGISFAIAAIYTKLDQLMIYNIAGDKEAGVYGLAARLATIMIFLIAAFNSSVIPRFSSVEKNKFFVYFKKTVIVSIIVAFSTIILAFTIGTFFIPIIFGEEFKDSVLSLQLLSIGIAFFAVTSPIASAITYHFKQPKFSLASSFLSMIIIIGLLNALIPLFKSTGAAIAVLLVYIFQFIISLIYFLYLRNKYL